VPTSKGEGREGMGKGKEGGRERGKGREGKEEEEGEGRQLLDSRTPQQKFGKSSTAVNTIVGIQVYNFICPLNLHIRS